MLKPDNSTLHCRSEPISEYGDRVLYEAEENEFRAGISRGEGEEKDRTCDDM
jgi:hypothetical protein